MMFAKCFVLTLDDVIGLLAVRTKTSEQRENWSEQHLENCVPNDMMFTCT